MKKIFVITIYFLLAGLLSIVLTSAFASDTPTPSSVTVAGSLQSELGCPGDWQPDCAATHLVFNANDNVWQNSFSMPAGNREYKAALNNSWTENYGGGGVRNGANIPLLLAAPANVKFYYDHETHWITDNVNSVIVTAAGSFQSEIGCSGDWDPSCLRSWLQDPDGDGIYTFSTRLIPPGNYEVKAAIDEGWTVNYGVGGVLGGGNILFTVPPATIATIFSYNANSHILSVSSESKKKVPPSIPLLLLSEEPAPGSQAVTIISTLRGDQEVPTPIVTAGSGTATLTVNVITGAISGSVTFSGLTSNTTAAHIQQAAAGVNGPVIVTLSGGIGATSGTWTVPAGSILTASQLAAFKTDGLYVNIHTANYPGGEIRAQIDFP